MKRTNMQRVEDHFREDIQSEGLFVSRPENTPCNVLEVRARKNSSLLEPSAMIFFKSEEGIEINIPESLGNYDGFKNITNLTKGVRILTELQRWGEEHGDLIQRSDSQGIWKGPHASKEYDDMIRPYGGILKTYKIHPQIYETD